MEPLIRTKALTKSFRHRGTHGPVVTTAVADANVEIRAGTTLGCVGGSGSGKSTLGRLILGLITPDSGVVTYKSRQISGLGPAEMRPLRRELGIVFQDPMLSLNPRRSVGASLARPLRNFGASRKAARERVEELMRLVGLEPRLVDRYPNEFSGGQCQRLAIARALALEPAFLFLDEPVSALDVSVQAQILNLLLDLQERLGLAYLFVTHDLRLIRFVAPELIVMEHGRIVEAGSSEQICAEPRHPYTRTLLSGVLRLDTPFDWSAVADDALELDAPAAAHG
ncbi:MAG: ATP-binding cassette domain-containing protein [Geminicoccaceae bacterium]